MSPWRKDGLGRRMLTTVNGYLERHGLKIGTGTIVDATILAAPSSTKIKNQQRDPEMHQVMKGKQWHFGMKAQVGVDAQTKLIHSAGATAANVVVRVGDDLEGSACRRLALPVATSGMRMVQQQLCQPKERVDAYGDDCLEGAAGRVLEGV